MIILTESQADQVRGVTQPGHALEPVPLTDGSFALPEQVLSDQAHSVHHELLVSLPTREVDDGEYAGRDVEG